MLGVMKHLSEPDQPVAQLPWQRGEKVDVLHDEATLNLPSGPSEGKKKKPIRCETVAFRNIFLPSRAIKEGTGILVYTIVAMTRTLKDNENGQTHTLLHAASKLIPSW